MGVRSTALETLEPLRVMMETDALWQAHRLFPCNFGQQCQCLLVGRMVVLFE